MGHTTFLTAQDMGGMGISPARTAGLVCLIFSSLVLCDTRDSLLGLVSEGPAQSLVGSMKENEKKFRYTCSIYNERPITCQEYPWNFANQIFLECIFVDESTSPPRLRTIEEQLMMNTEQEISDYCVECGRCCFFGPARCSKLIVTEVEND